MPTITGNYYLDCDVTIGSNWWHITGSDLTMNLCLNGYMLKGSSSGPVMMVDEGTTLNTAGWSRKTGCVRAARWRAHYHPGLWIRYFQSDLFVIQYAYR